jgi:hypothetical protein
MSHDGKEPAVEASPDYETIGRFIYGTARLEQRLLSLLGLMGVPDEDDAGLAGNARKAEAMFGKLAVDDATRAGFAALMQSVATMGEQQDEIAARFTEIPEAELAARVKDIADAAEQLKHFHAIAEQLVRPAEGV